MNDMIGAALAALVNRLPRWVLVVLAVGVLAGIGAWSVALLLPAGSADRLVLWLLLVDLLVPRGVR